MSVIGVIKNIIDSADSAISFAEKLLAYDSATENGRYYEIPDLIKSGLFSWIGIVGEPTSTFKLRKTRINNIDTSYVASQKTELIILLANMIGG